MYGFVNMWRRRADRTHPPDPHADWIDCMEECWLVAMGMLPFAVLPSRELSKGLLAQMPMQMHPDVLKCCSMVEYNDYRIVFSGRTHAWTAFQALKMLSTKANRKISTLTRAMALAKLLGVNYYDRVEIFKEINYNASISRKDGVKEFQTNGAPTVRGMAKAEKDANALIEKSNTVHNVQPTLPPLTQAMFW